MPNILFCGVGEHQVRAIEYARELGLGVIGFDGNSEAAGLKLCDKAEVLNIRDCDAVEVAALKWNKKVGIDGVIAPGVEVGPSVGRVVDVLGLRGIGEHTANVMTDKIFRCCALKKANIPSPRFAVNAVGTKYHRVVWDTFPNSGAVWNIFPAIIKPSNGSAAVGVKYINSAKELKGEDFDLIEEYIDGWQISTECLVMPDGSFYYANADRNYEKDYLPYMIENGCQLPSKIGEHIDSKISVVIQKLIRLWGLASCAIKLDLIVKDNIVYVLEVAPRLGGGRLSSHMIPLAFGIEWWEIAIKLAVGMPTEAKEFTPKYSQFCAQRYRFAEKVESNRDRTADEIAVGKTYGEAVEKAVEKAEALINAKP